MKLALHHIFPLIVAGLLCALAVAGPANAEQRAIKGIVSGEAIQKVGFRAMIQKQAIMYDLAGAARNIPDGTVASTCRATGTGSTRCSKPYASAVRNRREITPSASPTPRSIPI